MAAIENVSPALPETKNMVMTLSTSYPTNNVIQSTDFNMNNIDVNTAKPSVDNGMTTINNTALNSVLNNSPPNRNDTSNSWATNIAVTQALPLGTYTAMLQQNTPLMVSTNGEMMVDTPQERNPSASAVASPSNSGKFTTRKNAWGNMSYADLITQAIISTPDKRMTLAQIYEWMIKTIPYFRERADSGSSAGWKNSIRHNLSLHNRFIRVHNEGAGKSSWWVLNPEAKPSKSPRRRATTIESKFNEKRRGRGRQKSDTGSPLSEDDVADIATTTATQQPATVQPIGYAQLSGLQFAPDQSRTFVDLSAMAPMQPQLQQLYMPGATGLVAVPLPIDPSMQGQPLIYGAPLQNYMSGVAAGQPQSSDSLMDLLTMDSNLQLVSTDAVSAAFSAAAAAGYTVAPPSAVVGGGPTQQQQPNHHYKLPVEIKQYAVQTAAGSVNASSTVAAQQQTTTNPLYQGQQIVTSPTTNAAYPATVAGILPGTSAVVTLPPPAVAATHATSNPLLQGIDPMLPALKQLTPLQTPFHTPMQTPFDTPKPSPCPTPNTAGGAVYCSADLATSLRTSTIAMPATSNVPMQSTIATSSPISASASVTASLPMVTSSATTAVDSAIMTSEQEAAAAVGSITEEENDPSKYKESQPENEAANHENGPTSSSQNDRAFRGTSREPVFGLEGLQPGGLNSDGLPTAAKQEVPFN